MIYLGTFGMEDELRPSISNSIELIRYGRVLNQEQKDKIDDVKE